MTISLAVWKEKNFSSNAIKSRPEKPNDPRTMLESDEVIAIIERKHFFYLIHSSLEFVAIFGSRFLARSSFESRFYVVCVVVVGRTKERTEKNTKALRCVELKSVFLRGSQSPCGFELAHFNHWFGSYFFILLRLWWICIRCDDIDHGKSDCFAVTSSFSRFRSPISSREWTLNTNRQHIIRMVIITWTTNSNSTSNTDCHTMS